MLQIYCPYCAELREEQEFHYAGEAHIVRPKEPESVSEQTWGEYLFHRKNPKGIHQELWLHSAGCRKYFNVSRNTVTYVIEQTYKVGEQKNEEIAGETN